MDKYISRVAVRNTLYEADAITMKGVAILNQFPAADVVEIQHGQWNGGATGWECSVCTIESNDTYPYCPYCGAVMDVEENE